MAGVCSVGVLSLMVSLYCLVRIIVIVGRLDVGGEVGREGGVTFGWGDKKPLVKRR